MDEMRNTVEDVSNVIASLGNRDDKTQKEAIVFFLNQLH